jgi:hypothetical protein
MFEVTFRTLSITVSKRTGSLTMLTMMTRRWAVWERAKFGSVDDESARMMLRTMGGSLESMRRVGSTDVEFDNVDVDDVSPGGMGTMMSPCSAC